MMIFFCLVCIGNIFALGFCFVTLYVIVTTLRVLREKISDALDETLPDHLERRMKPMLTIIGSQLNPAHDALEITSRDAGAY
ncbi:MAG: hypothetical protein ACLSHC_06965 [Bilophila wadsworthia]